MSDLDGVFVRIKLNEMHKNFLRWSTILINISDFRICLPLPWTRISPVDKGLW